MSKTTAHSKEPWEGVADDQRPYGTIFANERTVRVATVNVMPGQLNVAANTKRIVACVNACEGIKHPDKAISGAVEALQAVQAALAAYRDNVDYVHPVHGPLAMEEVKYVIVDAALAKLGKG